MTKAGKKPINEYTEGRNAKGHTASKLPNSSADKKVTATQKTKVPYKKKPGKVKNGVTCPKVPASVKNGEKRKCPPEDGQGEPKAKTAKTEKMLKRELKIARKSLKMNYELSAKAIKLWEELRRRDSDAKKQVRLSNQIYDIIRGKLPQLIFGHDSSRVIEWIFLLGSKELSTAVFQELKPMLLKMMASKYARPIVKKFIKNGTCEQRQYVFSQMNSKNMALLKNSVSAQFVSQRYDMVSQDERAHIIAELYGPFASKYVKSGDRCCDLKTVLEKCLPDKFLILEHIKHLLEVLTEKVMVNYGVTHHLLREYLQNCTPVERTDMIKSLEDRVVQMIHTKDGAMVGMMCIWHGTVKTRKTIVKSMKTFIETICMDEYGHLVFLAIFDCVDDIIIVSKVIIEEMMKSIDTLWHDSHGHRVLVYLVAQRAPLLFSPDIINILKQGDDSVSSKKDKTTRYNELRDVASPYIMKYVENNLEVIFKKSSDVLVLMLVICHCTGDRSVVYKKIANMLTNLKAGNGINLFEDATVHMLVKRLFTGDKETFAVESNDAILFSNFLLQELTTDVIPLFIRSNRGCFTLLRMFETEISSIMSSLENALQPFRGNLKLQTSQGAELLRKALKNKKRGKK